MATAPGRILLFEDDEGQGILTKDALEKEGFVVEVCKTGHEGLDKLFQQAYQACLIDMQLPDIKGTDILRRINTIRPGTLCVIVTGHGDEIMAVEAMKLGAADYVVKSPYMGHLAALPLVLREGLERMDLRGERAQLQTELWEHARLLEERNAELRRVNEELKRIDQLKSDLVSMVSHELRTPLATIKEWTAILTDQIGGPVNDKQREYLTIIKTNVDRLARIIDDLLDMAKIEAGRVILNKGFTDVGPLLEHVMQSLGPLAKGKQVSLEIESQEEWPAVFADADKVTQILLNLVSNAIKFTPSGGRVAVGLEQVAHEVQFNVTDSGIGIAEQDLPKLFEKFQQIQRAPGQTGGHGTGLGLAISKRLVELHGGRIWVISQEGRGSTFAFPLPKYNVEEVFRESLKGSLERAKHQQSRLSLIVVTLENFQELKSLHGLDETSHLLKEIELLLRDTVRRRAGDIVVRWQRGEMVVILAEVDKLGAQAIAARIKEQVQHRAFALAGVPVTPDLSITTATYPDEALTDEELLKVLERGPQGAAAKTRIMVIDDEPKLRQFLKEILELREYEVLTAENGPDALQQLKRQKVHLILLDLMMPVMDGYEVYHLLKENPETRDVPVIIVTARGERKDRQLGIDSAPYNYLAKPFQTEDLMLKVREVLRRHAANAGTR